MENVSYAAGQIGIFRKKREYQVSRFPTITMSIIFRRSTCVFPSRFREGCDFDVAFSLASLRAHATYWYDAAVSVACTLLLVLLKYNLCLFSEHDGSLEQATRRTKSSFCGG